MDCLKLNSSGHHRQNPQPQRSLILAGVRQTTTISGTGWCSCLGPRVTGLMATGVTRGVTWPWTKRPWVTALHGAVGRDSPVPTVRGRWRRYLSWDLRDEKACQAEERARVKCGPSSRGTAGAGACLQAQWSICRLGKGPVSRNYIEEVGMEPDYIGRQERHQNLFLIYLLLIEG